MDRFDPLSLAGFLGSAEPAVAPVRLREELFAMWGAARAEANLAYAAWQEEPGPERYWAYRAAEERADAAQDALAGSCAHPGDGTALPAAA